MAKLRGLSGLIKRNMLVFITNKGSIFFSMLTPFDPAGVVYSFFEKNFSDTA